MPDTDTTKATVPQSNTDGTEAPKDDPTVEENPTVVGETPTTDTEDADDQGDTFPRSYVEELRRENARYRERAPAPTRSPSGCIPN